MLVVRAGDPDFWQLWEELRGEARPSTALYTRLDVEYQKQYPEPWEANDVSFIVLEGRRPVAGMLAAVKQHPGGLAELSGFGRPLFCLEKRDLDLLKRHSIFQAVKKEFNGILRQFPAASVIYQNQDTGLDPLGKHLIDSGAFAYPCFSQVIDLRQGERELHQQLRKSYQSLINWGIEHLSPRIVDHTNLTDQDFEAYHELHHQAAGRETRSKTTWDLNRQMVALDEAFLVLGTLDNRLVTGAFFNRTANYCYYSNAASDRSLFDKPLAHCVIWLGMAQARKLGCDCLEMGAMHFPSQPFFQGLCGEGMTRIPSSKELGIAMFKHGFGGETICRLDIVLRNRTAQFATRS